MYQDAQANLLTEGFQVALLKGYRERKVDAKEYFKMVGGYEDIPRALVNPPDGMLVDNWVKAIEYFQTDEHIIASKRNKKIREKQTNVNRGGSSLYRSTCYKKNLKRVETFRKAHTDKNGVFITAESEQQYLKNLRAMLADPACRDELYSFFQSQNNQGNDGNDDDDM
ncbi:uncharacterized protein LOC111909352 [Lactuca sativa]|uniref:uncharacterized protein LOC111909352 n=1 Tax=Lactuca sativa TaxID=4236 RepID=UPI001C68BF02|nr:uncharacterized protein LOC111909352 [Lactuca sativa]XP_042751661.1 uncharacterized protein LOC111909352 [Lactuca sativa]